MSKNITTIIRRPIQCVTPPHFLTREFVEQGINRFHRMTTSGGQNNLPNGEGPDIFASNHQNGPLREAWVNYIAVVKKTLLE